MNPIHLIRILALAPPPRPPRGGKGLRPLL